MIVETFDFDGCRMEIVTDTVRGYAWRIYIDRDMIQQAPFQGAPMTIEQATAEGLDVLEARLRGWHGRVCAKRRERLEAQAARHACPDCFPGRPGKQLIDCDGSAGFRACPTCTRAP